MIFLENSEDVNKKGTSRPQMEQKFDFFINVDDNFELNLSEEESEDLIKRLNQGPDAATRKFANESKGFYEAMKKKEEAYKKHKKL